jgi:hypothetical protein
MAWKLQVVKFTSQLAGRAMECMLDMGGKFDPGTPWRICHFFSILSNDIIEIFRNNFLF